ncbi:mCG1048654, partial [Mus musculus]
IEEVLGILLFPPLQPWDYRCTTMPCFSYGFWGWNSVSTHRRIWAATSYLPKSPAVTHSCWFWPWNLGDTGIMAIKSIRATATIIIMMTASTY